MRDKPWLGGAETAWHPRLPPYGHVRFCKSLLRLTDSQDGGGLLFRARDSALHVRQKIGGGPGSANGANKISARPRPWKRTDTNEITGVP